MGMVTIFELRCCHHEIIFGRSKGSDMFPPSLRICPFGCPVTYNPGGAPKRFELKFLRYASEELLSPELRATWRFPGWSKKSTPSYIWPSGQKEELMF